MNISNTTNNSNYSFNLLPLPECSSIEKSKTLLNEAKIVAEKLFREHWFPLKDTATGNVLQNFSEREINEILDKHVRFYDNRNSFYVKNNVLTDLYTENQECYGCLMASFTFALAEQINQGCSFSDLVDLACFGRQLISAFSEHISVAQLHIYGSPRVEAMETTFSGSYKGLEKRLADLKWDSESPWTSLDLPVQVTFLGIISNSGTNQPSDPVKLSNVILGYNLVYHCDPDNIPKGMQNIEKIFTDSLVLEGEALYRKLGEFFWWWCQVKPVTYGDPSIGEILFKAILLSKNDKIPGWKPGIIPWEETMVEYDGDRFGQNFHLLWE